MDFKGIQIKKIFLPARLFLSIRHGQVMAKKFDVKLTSDLTKTTIVAIVMD